MTNKDLAAHPFTLRQLDVFSLLCERGSFKEVGEALGISQASVSSQIKALEDQLGVQLFSRTPGQPTTPTHDGTEFLADLVLFREAATRLAAHSRKQPSVKEMPTVTVTAFVSQYIFNRLVRPQLCRFIGQNPNLDLHIRADHFDKNPSMKLMQADHDFILLNESDDHDLAPDTRKIASANCGVFGHRDFLKMLSSPITPEQISELPFVLPSKGTYFENRSLCELASHGIRPKNIVRRAQYFDVITAVLENGQAVGRVLEPLLSFKQRESVQMLFHTSTRRLSLYRNPKCTGPEWDAVEDFLVSAVLADPAYTPVIAHEAAEHAA